MQAAVENGEPRAFMARVAPDFIGNEGLDRDGLERMLRGQMLLNAKVGVQTGPLEVEMGQGTATSRTGARRMFQLDSGVREAVCRSGSAAAFGGYR